MEEEEESEEEPPCSGGGGGGGGGGELEALRQHRAWADRRIAALVRRVGEAERPAREEAARLAQEAQALRVRGSGLGGLGLPGGMRWLRLAARRWTTCCLRMSVSHGDALAAAIPHPWPPQAEKEGMVRRLRELERALARLKEGSLAEIRHRR